MKKRNKLLSVLRAVLAISVVAISITAIGSSLAAQDTTAYWLCKENVKYIGAGGSDCWGWRHPSGTEYAIMGIAKGVAFINTENMITEGFVEGPSEDPCSFFNWRDMMTWGNYCYVVSECTGTNSGIMVIDMSYLPDSVHLVGTFSVNGSGGKTSHNLCVDSLKGFLYVQGSYFGSTSVYIHDLTMPDNPTFIRAFGVSRGIHDIYAINDTVFVAEPATRSFSIWDLTDKNTPTLLARIVIPYAGYVHNIWPTENREYVITTEETFGKTVKIWDIRDLGNVTLVGEYLSNNGMAHNAHVKGDKVYISHYESGVVVLDISDPANLKEIAKYDTYPNAEWEALYNGTWGCYPFASNGQIYASNRDGRLWVLREDIIALADTIYPGRVERVGSDYAKVDIYAVNSQPLSRIVIPFSYGGEAPMTFLACSINGTRAGHFEISGLLRYAPYSERVIWEMSSGVFLAGDSIPPGSGKILTAWFKIGAGYSGRLNQIEILENWIGFEPTFQSTCTIYRPFELDYADICCKGLRGNVDDDSNENNGTILDLTFLVDFIFRGGPPTPCPQEADVNGSGGSGNIIDLTYLVDYIFRGGPGPVSCN